MHKSTLLALFLLLITGPEAYSLVCAAKVENCRGGQFVGTDLEGSTCATNPAELVGARPGELCRTSPAGLVSELCFEGLFSCCRCQDATTCTPSLDGNTVTFAIKSVAGVSTITASLADNVNMNQGDTITYTPAKTGSFSLQVHKVDPSARARIQLLICDRAFLNHCFTCDPVIALAVRNQGKPVGETFDGLPEQERYITIYNGSPGVSHLLVTVNGSPFRVTGLKDGEEETVDATSAMLSGEGNRIQVTAYGKPGSTATVFIHD